MTLVQVKEKALNLLSETLLSAGASEYLPKLNFYLDAAQKEVAGIKPIVKTKTVSSVNGRIEKGADVKKVLALMTTEYEVLSVVWAGNCLLVSNDDEYIIEYEAYPADILQDTVSYEFEIDKELQEALAFYGAAMCVIEDNPALYAELIARYDGMLANIKGDTRARFVGGVHV